MKIFSDKDDDDSKGNKKKKKVDNNKVKLYLFWCGYVFWGYLKWFNVL